jgi:TolA-binding protein
VVDNDAGYNNSGSSYPPAGYGTNGAYAGGGVSAPVSAQGELFNQLQQMQDQLSRQQGAIEVLQNEVSRMKQENLERYQDLDRRIGSGAAPAATPENSPAGGDLNAPGAAAGAGAGASAPAPAASGEPADPAK